MIKKIKINMPDKTFIEILADDKSIKDIIAFWNSNYLLHAVAVKINGELLDLNTMVSEVNKLDFADASELFLEEIITINSEQGIYILRHSLSHILAQAVKKIFTDVKLGIGPVIEYGFYYDFDLKNKIVNKDLILIEKEMNKIIKSNLPFIRKTISREEAIIFFKKQEEFYKVELLQKLAPEIKIVSLYSQGTYIDLCKGPHIPSTGFIKAFKLISLAGAYWRGNEKNKMLQRIYGVGFATLNELDNHLQLIEEAKKRDHRRIGKELNLFELNEKFGPGLVLFNHKGSLLRMIIENWEIKEHIRRGYEILHGPQFLKLDLWEKSGHLEHYRNFMYFTNVDNKVYGIKPMNCINHMIIYNSQLRSYKDLPIRYFELGTVHRHEKNGTLHGLFRLRQFTQDDAHIICTLDQVNNEIKEIISFILYTMKIFNFEYEVQLSTKPSNYIGSNDNWKHATKILEDSLKQNNINYNIEHGDGAFYGPKIDFQIKDALNRKWQCATIQCDFILPQRFNLTYIGNDGKKHHPIMLHRVILGAIERFIGVLIEHYAGYFPVWLSPIQVIILTINNQYNDYANNIYYKLLDHNIRVEKNFRNESLNLKIRKANTNKIPFFIIIGKNEVENNCISVRHRNNKKYDLMSLQEFIELIIIKYNNIFN